jgi:Lrp/AsnC family leucine-responsive transcriptional regulator
VEPIDDTDRRIVKILRDNARATFHELGEAVGLTGPAVFQRVKKLEEEGIITGYHAAVNPEALGRPLAAFLVVSPPAGKADGPPWNAMPAVVACYQLIDGDVLLVGAFAGLDDLADHVLGLRARGCQVRTHVAHGAGFARGNPLGV